MNREVTSDQLFVILVEIFVVPLRDVEWVPGLFWFPLVLGENVVAACKIGSFLCSLNNLLQKNVIVLFFGNQNSK